MGFNKTAREYGAFPTDPYSHTPAHSGAQQPGMTGQVKEEIITRFGELGIRIGGGALNIDPRLLRASEFTHQPRTFITTNVDGKHEVIELMSGSLAFTYCQTPFIYSKDADSSQIRIEINYRNDNQQVTESNQLPANAFQDVIRRTGNISSVRVTIPEQLLFK